MCNKQRDTFQTEEEEDEEELTGAVFLRPVHSASQQGGLRSPVKQCPVDTDGVVGLRPRRPRMH